MRSLGIYLKPYRAQSILAPLFKLLEALLDLLVPIVVAAMIDTGALGSGRRTVLLYFAALLGMAAVGLGFSVVAQFFAAKASVGFAGGLRQALFDHIQTLSFPELDALGSDTLITRLTDDVNQVQTGLNLSLRLLLRSPFIVLGALVFSFPIDTRCALVFTVAIPVLFLVILGIMLRSVPLFGKVQAGLDRVTALTRENLTGARVIRAFCREDASVAEFAASNEALTRLNLQVGKLSALMNPVTYVLINLATVLLIRQAGLQVELGRLSQGQAVALYNYMLQILVELIKLATMVITLNKSVACARRAASLFQVHPSMANGTAPAPQAAPGTPAVTFKDVSFTYPSAGAPSLRNISFSAQPGQTVGIIGGTGSGKSTLAHLLCRFYDVSSGRVLLWGEDIRRYDQAALRRQIAVVPQQATLFSGTIRDNLRWGDQDAADEALWQALTVAQARQTVEDKPGGLDFVLEQGGRNLSGGQKQRLTIARALVRQPKLLVLDDSASALDYATDAALRQALHQLHDTTVFVISQRIASVRQADQILVLDGGALAGCGDHAALLAQCPVYQDIYRTQFTQDAVQQQGGKPHG